jgi:hypothetical protein
MNLIKKITTCDTFSSNETQDQLPLARASCRNAEECFIKSIWSSRRPAVSCIAWLGAWDVFEATLELIFICFEADSEKFKYKVMAFLTNDLR